MKSLFFGCLLVIASSVIISEQTSVDIDVLNQIWQAFMTKYGKTYPSIEEENNHKKIFFKNYKYILVHNALAENDRPSYTLEINVFTDMTQPDVSASRCGFKPKTSAAATSSTARRKRFLGFPSIAKTTTSKTTTTRQPTLVYPPSVNYTAMGYVTPVKNQGNCASCWAFSATGAMEGQWYASTKTLVSLSEENLVDCSSGQYGNNGCTSGNMDNSFDYVDKIGGIDTEASYPYTAGSGTVGTCQYNRTNSGATFKSYDDLPSGNETALMEAVARIGPISVAIDGSQSDFTFYSSGIYNNPNCTNNVDHAVLIVGYGVQNGTDYWIVKNSWGTSWGMQGYILMSRNNGNQCGIASYASYPVN